jgi:hypothetical protein
MLVSDHLWVGPSMPNSAIGLIRGPILGAVRAMRGYVAKNDSDTVPLDDSPSGYGRTSRFACAPRGMCADYDEIELARWLLDRGMNVYEQAAIDSDGFGGQTPLFATVVSQPNFWMNHRGRLQTRRSRACCSSTEQIQMRAHHCANDSIPDTESMGCTNIAM